MDPKTFGENKSGRLLRTVQGYWAFVPDPLPPVISATWDLITRMSEADRALSELAGAAGALPNPNLLIRPFLRREAVLSSRIEGTQASLSDLFFFEANGRDTPQPPDVQEVANYVAALEYGLRRLDELPISSRLLREIHERLLDGVRGYHLTPGEFRRTQNWIGAAGCTLNSATYVPPPVPEMHEALGALENYVHAASDLPHLVRIAVIHYQFEAIHPFLDGNGRIGRLLITLLLCTEGLLPQPLLYLSAFFERRRSEYYRLLLEVSHHGRWTEWIEFFLAGVTIQSRDALRRARRLLGFQQALRNRLLAVKAGTAALQLADILFTTPVVTISGAALALNLSYRTAMLAVDKLVRAGVLVEATGKSRNRIYAAPAIIDIVDEPESPEDPR